MSETRFSEPTAPIDVVFDDVRKLLRIRFCGVVTAADMHAWANRVGEVLAKLGPDFVMLTDLSPLQEMEIDGVRDLTRVMDQCLHAGLKQVIRVIPDRSKDIGFHLLSMTHYRGRVPVVTFDSLAEAERSLPVLARAEK